jgi:N-acetylneuraminic acid mutarotase
MNARWSTLALSLGAFALTSCNDQTSPTGTPSRPDEPLTPEFAWASNSWQARARMPFGREHLAVGVVNNSANQAILYTFGGLDPVSFDGIVDRIDAYNYATDSWTTKVARFAAEETNGVGLIGGKLYISGGRGPSNGDTHPVLRTLYAYDPAADVITRKADMPRPTLGGVTGVIGGKLYVLTGGCGDCAVFASHRFWRYNPSTNSWDFLTQSPRTHLDGAGGVINGKFYVAGGFDDVSKAVTAGLDVYDPATNRWTARASMPKPLTQGSATVLNNKLYVIGGLQGAGLTGGQSVATVYAYDPSTNTWQTKAAMPTPRHQLAAATVSAFGNLKILALGGVSSFPTNRVPATANEAYKP